MSVTRLSRTCVHPLGRCAVLLALSATALGCAFFNKSDPVVLRYFTPETLAARPDPLGETMAMRPASLDLRIGRINAASYLKDRIAFRDRSFEIGYYEELRWTEKPEAYLRRALTRALFEGEGVRQIISGPGPTLDVDLDAFEELRSPRHVARMQVTWTLHDDEHVQYEETFTVERPIASAEPGGPQGIAAAMAEAFDETIKRVVGRVMVALPKTAPATPVPDAPPTPRTHGVTMRQGPPSRASE
jgi:cholesterol transport system auxiliary component